MGNSNQRAANEPAYVSGHQNLQGPPKAGEARQFAGAGNQATAGATSPGVSTPTITLVQAQETALRITTCFEGGKSMNYQALADDFDGQGISFGLIQWNFGQDTLGPLLKKMIARDAAAFAGCFGPTTNYAVLKSALDRSDQAAQLQWTRALQQSDNAALKAAFQAIGVVDDFNQIQREQAAAEFHPLVMQAVGQLRLIAPALMTALTFRSYAALFDLCVQQRSIARALDAIKARVRNEKPPSQTDLLKIAVIERGRLANAIWQSDCISRRMGILTGAPYESTENGITKKRGNPQLSLLGQFGAAQVAGL